MPPNTLNLSAAASPLGAPVLILEIVNKFEIVAFVKVPTLVKLEDVKDDGNTVSFLVKNCGIETPMIVPILRDQ